MRKNIPLSGEKRDRETDDLLVAEIIFQLQVKWL